MGAIKKAKKKAKKKVKKAKKKAKKKKKKALAPKHKKPTAGEIYREKTKKYNARVSAYKNSKKVAKEAARKARGARAAEAITKTNERRKMVAELHAAKDAQGAALNFEEQAIMAKSMSDKKVLIAKSYKVAQMAKEEKTDAAFSKAKMVMKKGLKLRIKMKALKV